MAADSAESAARQAADTTLQSNIDAEQSSREAADAAIEARIRASVAATRPSPSAAALPS